MLQLAYQPSTQTCDLQRNGQNLLLDSTLSTAVTTSLFTRRLAAVDDTLPDPKSTDRQGWWADKYAARAGRLWGSRLWLLTRTKSTAEIPATAADYVKEA